SSDVCSSDLELRQPRRRGPPAEPQGRRRVRGRRARGMGLALRRRAGRAAPMTEAPQPAIPPPPARTPGARELLAGCGVLALLLGVTIGLAWWLIVLLAGSRGDEAPVPNGAEPQIERRATPDGGRPTRRERLALEAELERVERQLAFARAQARSTADPGARDGWRDEIERLEAARDRLR